MSGTVSQGFFCLCYMVLAWAVVFFNTCGFHKLWSLGTMHFLAAGRIVETAFSRPQRNCLSHTWPYSKGAFDLVRPAQHSFLLSKLELMDCQSNCKTEVLLRVSAPHRGKEHWNVVIRSGNFQVCLAISRWFTFQFPDCLIVECLKASNFYPFTGYSSFSRYLFNYSYCLRKFLWLDEAVFLNNKTVAWEVFVACLFCIGHWYAFHYLC